MVQGRAAIELFFTFIYRSTRISFDFFEIFSKLYYQIFNRIQHYYTKLKVLQNSPRLKIIFFGLESDQAQYYGQLAVSKLYYTARSAVLSTVDQPLVTTTVTAVTIKSFSHDHKFISILNNAFRFEEANNFFS